MKSFQNKNEDDEMKEMKSLEEAFPVGSKGFVLARGSQFYGFPAKIISAGILLFRILH